MGLRDEITADIAEAFDEDLGDAVTNFTGTRIVQTGELDPISQEVPTETITYTGRGIFGSYDETVVDGLQILRTDTKITALQIEVTDTPKIDDRINGLTVINVGKDPAGVTWTIQARAS
ncbi:glutamate 5-kinase [Advenella sp. FME57]|uniref:glutamate 5-kinase n=1 Tax=Advenella sp. FME57 TaxID=2742604 RepID=UPI001866D270|nr:glutamate 5-kinase [Advenella sp. FME57]